MKAKAPRLTFWRQPQVEFNVRHSNRFHRSLFRVRWGEWETALMLDCSTLSLRVELSRWSVGIDFLVLSWFISYRD